MTVGIGSNIPKPHWLWLDFRFRPATLVVDPLQRFSYHIALYSARVQSTYNFIAIPPPTMYIRVNSGLREPDYYCSSQVMTDQLLSIN